MSSTPLPSSSNTPTLIGLLTGCFLISLDQNLVGIATPDLVVDLQATTLYGWISSSYLMGLTLAIPTVGRLVEVTSGRKIYLTSLIFFLAGTTLAGIAPDIHLFILARVLQGLGAGGVFATNFALAALLYSPREQGVILSYFNVVSGAAMLLGALAGGLLADHVGWRAVFFANLLPGLPAMLLLLSKMPELQPTKPAKMDVMGSVSLTVWCTALMLLCSWGNVGANWPPFVYVVFVLVFMAGLVTFVTTEKRHPEPLFDPHLIKNPTFVLGSMASWTLGSFTTGVMVYIPLFTVEAQNLSATESSSVLIVETACAIVSSVLVGKLVLRSGRFKPIMIVSTGLCAVIFYWASRSLDAITPLWQLLVMMALLGALFGSVMSLYSIAVQNSVARDRVATATSAVQFFQMMGSTMGSALLGLVLAASLNAHYSQLVDPEIETEIVESKVETFKEKTHLQDLVKTEIQELRHGLQQAQAGDKAALQTLRNNPLLPSQLRTELDQSRSPSDSAIAEELQTLSLRLTVAIEDITDKTVVASIRSVHLALAFLALLTMLFGMMIPGGRLHSQAPMEEEVNHAE